MNKESPIIMTHNFEKKKFAKLFGMYTWGTNPYDHCNRSLKKCFSKNFNINNPDFENNHTVILDEYPDRQWDAIYICGVRKGYWSKKQDEVYPHNVHFAIIPAPGKNDSWSFDGWIVNVDNAVIETVISEEDLDKHFLAFPKECTTCRIYRWSVTHYKDQLVNCDYESLRKSAVEHIEKHKNAVNKRRKQTR